MSDLQKSFAKARLAKLPPEPPVFEDVNAIPEHSEHETTEPHEDDDSSVSSTSSTGTIKPSPTQNLFSRPLKGRSGLTSLPWMDFFDRELFLEQNIGDLHIVHHAYISPPTGSGPLFVTHHGAGSSGLSFAACTVEIKKLLPNAGVLSLDARNHGSTTISSISGNDSEIKLDFTLDTLSRDLVFVVKQSRTQMKWETLPDLVLVGHSLGGAVITDVAKKGELGSKLLAYAVLDVVEGSSAMDALQSMETYLSTRPSSFLSLASGIEWHTRSRTIRNTTSARVSVPALLQEEPSSTDSPWKWRTDLAATMPFWENWFLGLSKKFLEARGGKLLLLAGTDRLDKELMIGQMQGKYQLQVFPDAGHFIQEDQPAKTAQVLVDFYKRNDRSALVLPPKVGDILASKAMGKGTGVGAGAGAGAGGPGSPGFGMAWKKPRS
ncbi:hypothetical protein AJ80_02698 [Polytolypa hystricis UAMH7299]|uniref:Protein phosphatase methylesterase 1 n=1 Tax=Polytolypa hystricis (strain UAMH7299) TaxID=1447883 RepID=A0A2B7YQZ8_POLH7|nr:hypothetical protein AJ80_02698 [Polytolypa hystricis UAMH7299]